MPSLEWLTHHRLLTLGLGVAAVVVAVAVGVWFFVLSNPTTPLNLRQALRLYRQDQRGAADTALALPTAGVYRYRTTGGEHLSFAEERALVSGLNHQILVRSQYAAGILKAHASLVTPGDIYIWVG